MNVERTRQSRTTTARRGARVLTTLTAALLLGSAGGVAGQSAPPAQVSFYGSPTAAIASGVVIPADRASLWVSGTPPVAVKADAATARERFGDTKAQAAGILKTIQGQLVAKGLDMKDVVYVRAYLVADPAKGNKIDVPGWNAAFSEVFGTATTPIKPARSTVGVASLVGADWLVEVEAFAVYPAAH